jgi:hypothetical protein
LSRDCIFLCFHFDYPRRPTPEPLFHVAVRALSAGSFPV